MEVSLHDILNAREARVRRQEALLAEYGGVLVCFTMNIAGPVKHSALIEAGFRLGQAQILRTFSPLHSLCVIDPTGCEGYMYCTATPWKSSGRPLYWRILRLLGGSMTWMF